MTFLREKPNVWETAPHSLSNWNAKMNSSALSTGFEKISQVAFKTYFECEMSFFH